MGRAMTLLRRRLIHTCTVTPRLGATVDPYNQADATWGTPVAGVPCRLTDLTDAEVLNAREAGTQVMTDALLVPLDVAIRPFDRVAAILDKAGQPVEDGPFVVRDVTTRFAEAAAYRRVTLRRAG
jgi:hypothetical protein